MSIHLVKKTQPWTRWQAVPLCCMGVAWSLRVRFAIALCIRLSVSISKFWPNIWIFSDFAQSCLIEFDMVPFFSYQLLFFFCSERSITVPHQHAMNFNAVTFHKLLKIRFDYKFSFFPIKKRGNSESTVEWERNVTASSRLFQVAISVEIS